MHAKRFIGWLSLMLAPLCLSGCSLFMLEWDRANDTPLRTDSLVGIWAGPYVENGNEGGYIITVISETKTGGYEAFSKVYAPHFLFKKAHVTNGLDTSDSRFEFKVPLYVVDNGDGTFEVASEALRAGYFTFPHTLTLRGQATLTDIALDLSRGKKTGKVRLRKLTPSSEQFYFTMPGLLAVNHNPKELHEQIEEARQMPIDEPLATRSLEQTVLQTPGEE